MDAVAASGLLALTAATPSMSLRPGGGTAPKMGRWPLERRAVACRWVPADGCVTSCHRFLMAQPALCPERFLITSIGSQFYPAASSLAQLSL